MKAPGSKGEGNGCDGVPNPWLTLGKTAETPAATAMTVRAGA